MDLEHFQLLGSWKRIAYLVCKLIACTQMKVDVLLVTQILASFYLFLFSQQGL
jgi:hypothetical protein